MNHVGMFSAIMTFILLLAVCGSVLRSGDTASSVWLSTRTVYYIAGILVSGYYLHYLTGANSATASRLSLLSWNNFVPLVFCIFGLIHSIVVRQTRPRSDGYTPHLEADELMFRDERSR